MLHQVVTQNQLYHRPTACTADHLARGRQKKQHSYTPTAINVHEKALPFANREAITKKLSFLKPYQNSIHSLILVGSTAYNANTTNSDIDIVIITTTGGHEKVCNFLFEKEIDEALSGHEKSKFEYTVLSSQHTEKLFQISSPFAYSIRHGVIIEDDGYLLMLRNKRFPLLPEKEYYSTCLYENIATPYYGMLKKLRSETKEKGCSSSCSRKTHGCQGLQSAQQFAKLILSMFYVTLPSRGMIPLTKGDVVTYAKMAYGSHGESVAEYVVSLMRDNQPSFCFDEFKMLKKFAIQLFKEILSIIGFSKKTRAIIVDAARVAKGDFHLIDSPAMRNCVV